AAGPLRHRAGLRVLDARPSRRRRRQAGRRGLQLSQRHQSPMAQAGRSAPPARRDRAMTGSFLPYGRQVIDDADIAAVAEVLRGDYLTTGPTVATFERALAEAIDAPHVA